MGNCDSVTFTYLKLDLFAFVTSGMIVCPPPPAAPNTVITVSRDVIIPGYYGVSE